MAEEQLNTVESRLSAAATPVCERERKREREREGGRDRERERERKREFQSNTAEMLIDISEMVDFFFFVCTD
jgi:hypothetical protein